MYSNEKLSFEGTGGRLFYPALQLLNPFFTELGRNVVPFEAEELYEPMGYVT